MADELPKKPEPQFDDNGTRKSTQEELNFIKEVTKKCQALYTYYTQIRKDKKISYEDKIKVYEEYREMANFARRNIINDEHLYNLAGPSIEALVSYTQDVPVPPDLTPEAQVQKQQTGEDYKYDDEDYYDAELERLKKKFEKEKASERKEPELNIDQYSGPAAEVDVDNLVNGLSHADEVGYAKSTLDGTEDTLKDTGDYITARDKNLTKEEEKQYRADLDADVYGRNARINDNIARGSKGENANNRNFETTLRYSRLADALNNRVHTRASLPSVISFSAFGPSANIAGQRAELYQMPKIETEEMRQMNTVRDLSKDQSGRQINRQQNYRDAAQELTANEMQDKLKLQTELSKRLMDRRDKFTDEEMRQWYQTQYDEEMKRKATEWEKKFGRDFGIESARFIAEMNKADPTLAAIMGKALNIVPPDYVQQFLTEVLMPYGRALRAGEPVSKVIERAAYDFGNFAANGLYGFTKGGAEGIMDAIKEILS